MKFSKFELKMFNAAHCEAEKSDFKQFNIGCVITYKGHIIGRGHNQNKTHPMQKKYNRKYRKLHNSSHAFIQDSIHAEMDAINSIPYTTGIETDFSKAKLFVYRISPGKRLGYGKAKPCAACMEAIRKLGIKKIYYTDEDGFNYLQLED